MTNESQTKTLTGIITWAKNWFYDKTEIAGFLNLKANQSDFQTLSGTVSSLSSTVSGKADASHTHSSADVTESSALSNIGTSANATQHAINVAIDTKIGDLIPVDWIIVVSTLPTASASTMGRMYLVPKTGATGDNVFIEYVTVRSGTSGSYTYDWEKLGELSGSGLSVDWADITNKPSTFTPSSHAHGQVTNDGKITSTAVTVASGDNIVITDASDSSKVKRVANLLASHVKDSNAHTNINSSANDSQETINTKIDTKISSMVQSISEKADEAQLADVAFSGDYDDLDNVPSTFAPSSHTHAISDVTNLEASLVDWSYTDANSGFTNGVRLVPMSEDSTGTIELKMKA